MEDGNSVQKYQVSQIFGWANLALSTLTRRTLFLAGGNVNGDTHTTWFYNWNEETWTIQDFATVYPSKCVPVIVNGVVESILAGRDDFFGIFNLKEAKWGPQIRDYYCDFDNLVYINNVPVTLSLNETLCSFNGTNWIVSPNITLSLDYPRSSSYDSNHVSLTGFSPIQGKRCQSNVMVLTGQANNAYVPFTEIIPIGPSKEDCRYTLPNFPLTYFDLSLALDGKSLIGCDTGRCLKLDPVRSQWFNINYGLNGYAWNTIEPTYFGLWKTGGGNVEYQSSYCFGTPQQSTYCTLLDYTVIHCYGNNQTIRGPQLPYRMMGHCTVHLNDTHTMIAGGLQTRQSKCQSSPFLNADTNCKSTYTWVYDWGKEEWTRLPDLPNPAAFASCGDIEIGGKKFVFLYGQTDERSSRTGSVQLWSFETETWSADVPQPPGNFRSLPG
jgi:hypothetical protein